jgi:hypothetical protein
MISRKPVAILPETKKRIRIMSAYYLIAQFIQGHFYRKLIYLCVFVTAVKSNDKLFDTDLCKHLVGK